MKLKIIITLVVVSLVGIGGGIYLGGEYKLKNEQSAKYSAKIVLHEKFVKEAGAKYQNFAWTDPNPEFNSDKLDNYNKSFVVALDAVAKSDKEIINSYPVVDAENNKEIFVLSKKVSESMAKRSLFIDCIISKKVLEIDYLEVAKLKNFFLESDKLDSKITLEEDDIEQAKYITYLEQVVLALENTTNCATSHTVGVDITEVNNLIKKYKKYAESGTRYLDIVDEADPSQEKIDKADTELKALGNNYKLDEGKNIRDYILKIIDSTDKAVIRK